jgi:DNA-binding NarL/FixJ family response regulator
MNDPAFTPSSRKPLNSFRISLVLIEDHQLVREAIKALLQTEPSFEIVGESKSGVEGLSLIQALQPDVVLLDLEIPDLHGIELLQKLGPASTCRILILSAHSSEHFLRQALAFGADGYLVKDSCGSELIKAVQSVAHGEGYISPELRKSALQASLKLSGIGSDLTAREGEVLKLAAVGKTSGEIAEVLSISRRTAEAHRANLMKKLALKTQSDLVLYALRKKIIETDSARTPDLKARPARSKAEPHWNQTLI